VAAAWPECAKHKPRACWAGSWPPRRRVPCVAHRDLVSLDGPLFAGFLPKIATHFFSTHAPKRASTGIPAQRMLGAPQTSGVFLYPRRSRVDGRMLHESQPPRGRAPIALDYDNGAHFAVS